MQSMVNFVTLHVIKFTINYMEALTFDTTEKILLAATGVLLLSKSFITFVCTTVSIYIIVL